MFSILHGKVTLRRTTTLHKCEERVNMADEKAAEKEQENANDQTTDHSPDAAQMGASDGGGKSTWKDGPMKT